MYKCKKCMEDEDDCTCFIDNESASYGRKPMI